MHLLLNFKFRLKSSGTDNYIYFYTVYERNVTWNRNYHMLYIDNPVGTGFSFTSSSDHLSTTEDEVTDNLYRYLEAILFLFYFFTLSPFFLLLSLLLQFLIIFPEYQRNPLYITGEVSMYVHVLMHNVVCVCVIVHCA